jgi:hypothetical protein
MIISTIGDRGSFKTSLARAMADEAAVNGVPIFANIKFKGIDYTHIGLKDFLEKEFQDCLVEVDEASLWFDSREGYGLVDRLGSRIAQLSRHTESDFNFLTQLGSMLEYRIRGSADIYFYTEKYPPIGDPPTWFKLRLCKRSPVALVNYMQTGDLVVLKTWKWDLKKQPSLMKLFKEIWAGFDTHQKYNVMEEAIEKATVEAYIKKKARKEAERRLQREELGEEDQDPVRQAPSNKEDLPLDQWLDENQPQKKLSERGKLKQDLYDIMTGRKN